MNHSPHQHNTSGTSFCQRLAYFMVGTAIGLVALGFIKSSRQRAVQQQAADRAQAKQSSEENTGKAVAKPDEDGSDPIGIKEDHGQP